jgi:hypothetical protein
MTRPEFCNVSNPECVNPAGFGVAGYGAASNPDGPRIRVRCHYCGEPVCAGCRVTVRGRVYCVTHDEEVRT